MEVRGWYGLLVLKPRFAVAIELAEVILFLRK